MIPPFLDTGYLPAGIHPATLSEIEARFGKSSEPRYVQMESIRWLIELAKKADVQRIILNGSFVTDTIEPNDVDCALLVAPALIDSVAEEELEQGLPFLDIAMLDQTRFHDLITVTFGSDRHGNPSGVIKVIP